jgi:CBS-domain-containing membrane protein
MTVFLVILLLQLERVVIIASIGASAFIVFAMPQSITAKRRNLIGGHTIGLLVGSLFGLVPHPSTLLCAVLYALCVGATIFLMVATDTEHPPAAGTALGVAMMGLSPTLVVSMVTSILVLALVHHLFRSRLLDLV